MKTEANLQSFRRALMGASFIAISASSFSTGAEAGFSFATIDPPGSVGTTAVAINNNSHVAGYYDNGTNTVGFWTQDLGTTFQTFAIKHSNHTEVDGLSDKDQITGFFFGNNTSTCYFRRATGKVLTCGPVNQKSSVGNAVNVHGVVTGYYSEPNENNDHGFLWDSENGATTFDAPGAFDTVAVSISDTGLIAGRWDDLNGGNHGFARDAGGTIVEFDVPGAQITNVFAINSSGIIVGDYFDGSATHSYIRDSSGNITVFDPKGMRTSEALGINKKGVVVGFCADVQDVTHGFERLPGGKIKTFDILGASHTEAAEINNNGFIVGNYLDSAGVWHGYVGDFGP